MKKRFGFAALTLIAASAAVAAPAPIYNTPVTQEQHRQMPVGSVIVAVANFDAGPAHADLMAWKRPDGHECRQYASAVNKDTVRVGVLCDDDRKL
ncbi:hypothetical protein [Paraburkholderia sp. GAS32]|uniref:hypothetical protein n=1 Tax=Paraburkholderia sp. GAS32 TaxID=3035129 RepID=UPI003D21CA8B